MRMFLKVVTIAFLTSYIFALRSCPQVTFIQKTDKLWSGEIELTSPSDINRYKVQIFYEHPATVLNDGERLAAKLSGEYKISGERSTPFKRDESMKFNISFELPSRNTYEYSLGELKVKMIKFNDVQMCPSEESAHKSHHRFTSAVVSGPRCVEFKKEGVTTGKWNGSLTVYPEKSANTMSVEIKLDVVGLSYGVTGIYNKNLSLSLTSDPKRFRITVVNPVSPSTPFTIKFYVLHEKFGETPELETVYIDEVPTCIMPLLTDVSTRFEDPDSGEGWPEGLPFERFLTATQSPNQVAFKCGSSGSIFQIANGAEAQSGQFPFHVAIFRYRMYVCGGSLISSKAVLSAAHCVVDGNNQLIDKKFFRLLFGAIDLKNLTGSEALRKVAEIIKHPDYVKGEVYKEDIALIFIKGNLKFSETINPICLLKSQTPIVNLSGKQFIILGFGSNTISTEPSRYLLYGRMSIINRKQCVDSNPTFNGLSQESAICAKSVEDMIVCPGDSGGGLITMVNGKYHLIGSTSFTIKPRNINCDPTRVVVFSDASFFLTWINSNKAEN